jgi:predicted amidohydrolase
LRVAAAQAPDLRDDVESALAYVIDAAQRAMDERAHLLCFPEAFLQGYITARDAAHRVAVAIDSLDLRRLVGRLPAPAPVIVLGMIERADNAIFNTAVVIRDRRVIGRYRKRHLLPGECAFEAGSEMPVFPLGSTKFAINICYDTNFPSSARDAMEQGARLIVCPANNMLQRHRAEQFRHIHNAVRAERCRESNVWLLSSDVTGERDGSVSWGPTALLNPRGEVVDELPLGRPGLLVADIAC